MSASNRRPIACYIAAMAGTLRSSLTAVAVVLFLFAGADRALEQGRTFRSPDDARQWLTSKGISVPRWRTALTKQFGHLPNLLADGSHAVQDALRRKPRQ